MTSKLTLDAIRRDDDPRVIVLTLSLDGQRFEDRFVPTPRGATPLPLSPFGFTREELAVRPIVDQWLRGESVSLPAPIEAPADLSPKDLRRGSYFDSPTAKKLARARAASSPPPRRLPRP